MAGRACGALAVALTQLENPRYRQGKGVILHSLTLASVWCDERDRPYDRRTAVNIGNVRSAVKEMPGDVALSRHVTLDKEGENFVLSFDVLATGTLHQVMTKVALLGTQRSVRPTELALRYSVPERAIAPKEDFHAGMQQLKQLVDERQDPDVPAHQTDSRLYVTGLRFTRG